LRSKALRSKALRSKAKVEVQKAKDASFNIILSKTAVMTFWEKVEMSEGGVRFGRR